MADKPRKPLNTSLAWLHTRRSHYIVLLDIKATQSIGQGGNYENPLLRPQTLDALISKYSLKQRKSNGVIVDFDSKNLVLSFRSKNARARMIHEDFEQLWKLGLEMFDAGWAATLREAYRTVASTEHLPLYDSLADREQMVDNAKGPPPEEQHRHYQKDSRRARQHAASTITPSSPQAPAVSPLSPKVVVVTPRDIALVRTAESSPGKRKRVSSADASFQLPAITQEESDSRSIAAANRTSVRGSKVHVAARPLTVSTNGQPVQRGSPILQENSSVNDGSIQTLSSSSSLSSLPSTIAHCAESSASVKSYVSVSTQTDTITPSAPVVLINEIQKSMPQLLALVQEAVQRVHNAAGILHHQDSVFVAEPAAGLSDLYVQLFGLDWKTAIDELRNNSERLSASDGMIALTNAFVFLNVMQKTLPWMRSRHEVESSWFQDFWSRFAWPFGAARLTDVRRRIAFDKVSTDASIKTKMSEHAEQLAAELCLTLVPHINKVADIADRASHSGPKTHADWQPGFKGHAETHPRSSIDAAKQVRCFGGHLHCRLAKA